MSPEQLREIVRQATAAPSIHNTQPWRFRIGADQLDLLADPSRALDVVDPTGRQLVLSCGAALEHAVLAARAAGAQVSVTPLPDPGDADHLARLEVVGQTEPSAEDLRLVEAMPRRHTSRGEFSATPVPPELVRDLTRGVAALGARLHPLTDREDLVVASVLLDRADEIETGDPAYREELSHWRRAEADTGAEDGIPTSAVPVVGPRTSLAMRDFSGAPANTRGSSEDAPVERPLVVVLTTEGDGRADWLLTGRGMGWVLLRAAAEGVQASPLGQVIDVPATRAMLGRELRLLGHPQMVLRMGYPADAQASVTPRRGLESVIEPPSAQ
ncbi:MAG: nitroreductase [Frankiaceae bacterium]